MHVPAAAGLSTENPQAEAGEVALKPSWWNGLDSEDMRVNVSNMVHAANASCAAFHADVAAKQAASLAHWVQHLWGQVATLNNKVIELEDWKRRTLDDMSKLKFEHKLLRRQLLPEERGVDGHHGLPPKTKSLPLLLADHVELGESAKTPKKAWLPSPGAYPPPRGLWAVAGSGKAVGDFGKQVRFAERILSGSSVTASLAPSLLDEDGEQPGALRAFSAMSSSTMTSEVSMMSDSPTHSIDDGPLEGVHVVPAVVDGLPCERAEWRIGHLSAKLRNYMGRPLVSSPFSAGGLEDLRLMVFPDGREATKGPRSRRQKELYAKKVSEGPLEGTLKLKVPECPPPHIIEYWLRVGLVRRGPFRHNFAESTVNGCYDFGIDWWKQVEADQSLTVSLEILLTPAAAVAVEGAEGFGDRPAAACEDGTGDGTGAGGAAGGHEEPSGTAAGVAQ